MVPDPTSTWANIFIGTAVGVIMLVIAIAGIKITARTQVSMAVIEYAVLLGLSIAGLVLVLMHHHGTVPVSLGWLSPAGIGGAGSAADGFLVAVFMFTGWDGTLYVNEEVTNRHRNPGRAAIAALIILGVIYTLCTMAFRAPSRRRRCKTTRRRPSSTPRRPSAGPAGKAGRGGCRRADGHVLVPGPAARHRPADPERARQHDALGPIGKAAGFADDARLTRLCAAYPALDVLPGRAHAAGDALARLRSGGERWTRLRPDPADRQ